MAFHINQMYRSCLLWGENFNKICKRSYKDPHVQNRFLSNFWFMCYVLDKWIWVQRACLGPSVQQKHLKDIVLMVGDKPALLCMKIDSLWYLMHGHMLVMFLGHQLSRASHARVKYGWKNCWLRQTWWQTLSKQWVVI